MVVPSETITVSSSDNQFRLYRIQIISCGSNRIGYLKGWISSTLDDEVLPFVVRIKTSTELMNYLSETFAQLSEERELDLQTQIADSVS